MILLSPPKLMVILVIALVVLGPDKLPSTARRIGALWSDVKRWRAHVESEVRATFPDLPSTTEIARAVRSPISMLDRLADEHATDTDPADAGQRSSEGEVPPFRPAVNGPLSANVTPSGQPSAHGSLELDAARNRDAASMN